MRQWTHIHKRLSSRKEMLTTLRLTALRVPIQDRLVRQAVFIVQYLGTEESAIVLGDRWLVNG